MINSPLGKIFLVFSGLYLTEISYTRPALLKQPCPEEVRKQFREYFSGARRRFSIKTQFPEGTPFQREVWKALLSIPYGETMSYKWVAERVGRPEAFRAVGQAVGRNPLPILYPCHRVINADGRHGGYRGGLRKKGFLLDLEQQNTKKN